MDDTQKLQLKVRALLERVSTLTTAYENQVADLRVEGTDLAQVLDAVQAERDQFAEDVTSLRKRLEELTDGVADGLVEEEAPEDASNDTD